jgi:hypothetical protein
VGGGTGYMTNIGLGIAHRALLSGEELSAGTIQWGRRKERPPRLALTDRDLRLMALLHGANFLSMSQLAVLGWDPSSERAAQMRLKRLHDGGYVDRFRPAHAYGRAEWNYRLASCLDRYRAGDKLVRNRDRQRFISASFDLPRRQWSAVGAYDGRAPQRNLLDHRLVPIQNSR